MNASVQTMPQKKDRPGYIAEALKDLLQTGLPVKEIQLAEGDPLSYLSPKGYDRYRPDRLVHEDDLGDLMEFAASGRGYKPKDRLANRSQYDESLTCGGQRLRCNFYRESGRTAASIRCLPLVPWDYASLGGPPQLQQIVDKYTSGLILVTGPVGSGKSTTLAALLNHINVTRSCKILTLEDPIEYLLKSDKAMVSQRQVGDMIDGGDVPSFTAGLLGAKRQHADVILVGELRDTETVKTAFQAAEAGALVFASTHSDNAVSVIQALLSYFPSEQQEHARMSLATTLRAILSQKILPSIDRKEWVLAYEYLPRNPALLNLLKENKVAQIANTMREARHAGDGMTALNANLRSLVEHRKVDSQVALAAAYEKRELAEQLQVESDVY